LRIIEVHPNGLVVITIRRSKANQRGDDEEVSRGLDAPSVPRRRYGMGDHGRLHTSTAAAAWGEHLMDDTLATRNA
jgi:hypothetical protein